MAAFQIVPWFISSWAVRAPPTAVGVATIIFPSWHGIGVKPGIFIRDIPESDTGNILFMLTEPFAETA